MITKAPYYYYYFLQNKYGRRNFQNPTYKRFHYRLTNHLNPLLVPLLILANSTRKLKKNSLEPRGLNFSQILIIFSQIFL